MNYIFLDCEWDTFYIHKKGVRRPINELIEIGAVKLDENFNEVSRFSQVIKSSLSKKLTKRFIEFTKITTEEMKVGKPFKEVVSDYINWCGQDAITMTWSNSDLYVILDNCKTFLKQDTIPFIKKYADLQKYAQSFINKNFEPSKNQISLENAAQILDIKSEDISFHRAVDDAFVCAEIFKKVFSNNFSEYVSNIDNADYYRRLTFKPYIIKDINSEFVDRSLMKFNCSVCGNKLKRLSDWKFAGYCFKAVFNCETCNRKFCGKISFKKKYESVSVRKYVSAIETAKQ